MERHGSWRPGELAGQTTLECRRDGVRLVFCRGPRWKATADGRDAGTILQALGAGALRWCEQVHGRLVASLSAEAGRPLSDAAAVGRCDGLMTADAGVALAIRTADCVPVLLHGGGVVAAVHAGWRGVVAGIVPAVVRRFEVEYGVGPHELRAALGPSIGPCHYEVGPEVLEALAAVHSGAARWRWDDRVDLRSVLEGQLAASGVPAAAVERVGGCTACDPQMASHRRDGERSGRQLSLALIPLDEPG